MSNFTNAFIERLNGKVTDEDLSVIYSELESFVYNFEISERETRIATVDIFPTCYKMFFITKKIGGCSDGTITQYKLQLDYFFEWINKPLKEITTEDILAFLYHLQAEGKPNQKPLTANVADGVRRVINSFFEWATKNGHIDKNPVAGVGKIKGEIKRREPLSEFDLERVRYAISHEEKRRKIKRYGKVITQRNEALLEVLYSTGARISEVIALNKSDVNFQTQEVYLFGKGKKHRISYLNAKAVVALSKYLESREDSEDALFVTYKKPIRRMTVAGARRELKRWGASAGVNVFPHRIRHTTATHALAHGMPLEQVQRLLGHSKPETTLIYADVMQENVKYSHLRCVI